MTDDKPSRIFYAKPPHKAPRKAPPARVTIPVIVTAKKPRKVDVERRYAKLIQQPDES
jgi:hypothetical protein